MKKSFNNKIIDHYNQFNEKDRLASNWGKIEFIRTKAIIEHYLPASPAIILDVGGAAGIYSCWLARKGYEVHLIDAVVKHIEQAKQASGNQADCPIASITLGDARQLDFKNYYADAVLLMGPLYHLLEYEDRLDALSESHRVLKKGGLLFAVGISRFASCVDGLMSGYFKDPEFQKIMKQDLTNGQHRNPTDNELYFTDAYFHRPEELRSEINAAEFALIATHAIEGIGYMLKDFDENWNIEAYRKFVLNIIRRIDKESSLIGASPHFMCVASKSQI